MGRIRCKTCDTIVESKYRHDFRGCKCPTKSTKVYIDGGHDYLKYSWPEGEPSKYVEVLPCEKCIENHKEDSD